MPSCSFSKAVDQALAQAMARDDRIVVFGEDVPMLRPELFARFGARRVLGTPISEGAFVGAAVGAAMAGLRPVVEVMMVDFIAVALDPILNHMAKLEAFSDGKWRCPVVLRAACGAGYGDGGQHGQALWGLLGGIPGLTVVVPSTPLDAAGLMLSALAADGPVIFLEHKLLSESWLEFLGRGGRTTVTFDVPPEGATGEVPDPCSPTPIGSAETRRSGGDLTIASLAVGVHRALAAAEALERRGISAEVIDLRTVRPLDRATVTSSVARTGRLLVVDEDVREMGISGELAASVLEAGLAPRYRRVCTEGTLPYDRAREAQALPHVAQIVAAALELTEARPPL
ncbi:MAG: pyruvate dehydrogenase [Deltaproteobacteria bacterium]|nr:pyruvate dehydrogenase [Deltaproteobacteria bacterium]